MSTNQEQELVQAVVGEENFFNVIFTSDEEMKAYYLHLAYLLNPQLRGLQCDEAKLLKELLRKLTKFRQVIQSMGSHPWEEGVLEIQTALGYYMTQPHIDRSKQLQINASIGKHLQFLTLMASQTYVTKHIEAVFHLHCICLRTLLKQQPTSEATQ